MRIFNKLCQQPKDRGLPKGFLWSFWVRLCFAQIGHAAMSYDSEKAVLLACHLDNSFKDRLRSLVQPVVDAIEACRRCSLRQCPVKKSGPAEAEQWFEEMVSGNRWQRLHLWVAAVKLLQEPRTLQILRQQQGEQNGELAFSAPEALKMLLTPDCMWDTPLQRLLKLDFVVRDLTFASTLAVQLDVDSLVAAPNGEHPDWSLLERLGDYMMGTLYETVEAQLASVLFQRVLASMLLARKIDLEALFGLGTAGPLGDDELSAQIKKTAAGREVFEPMRRRSWRAWRVNTYLRPGLLPADLEREVTGYRKGYLTQHTSTRATCFKLEEDHWLAIAISYQDLNRLPTAKAFIKLCRSILYKHFPQLQPDHLANAVFEGLLDRRFEHQLPEAVDLLSDLDIPLPTLRKAANVVNDRASRRSEPSSLLSIKIGDYEYPAYAVPWILRVNIMHAALSGSDSVRTNLGVSIKEAAQTLWTELLRWQSEYFGLRTPRKILGLLDAAQRQLAERVVDGRETAARDLEIYTLLESLRHPERGVSFRVALPNARLMMERGRPENEYDVLVVTLKDDKYVEVWVWGATTEANVNAKRTEDLGKIQSLKDLLGSRWESDVRVVTCYVHRRGGDIVLDIDGRQQRRALRA